MHIKMKCKRALAFLLALLMLMTMIPMAAFAEELPSDVATSTDVTTDPIASQENEPMSEKPTAPDEEAEQPAAEDSTAADDPAVSEEDAPAIESEDIDSTEIPDHTPEESTDSDAAEETTDAAATEQPAALTLQETIDANGFAYVQAVRPTKVYNTPDLSGADHIYTLTDTDDVLLATEHNGNTIKVWYYVGADAAMRGYVDADDLADTCLSADEVADLTSGIEYREYSTDAGYMTLYLADGEFNLIEESTTEDTPAEEPEADPENETITEEETGNESEADDPAVDGAGEDENAADNAPQEPTDDGGSDEEAAADPEAAEGEQLPEDELLTGEDEILPESETGSDDADLVEDENLPDSSEEVLSPALIGDYLQVTTDTRVFSEIDKTATTDYFGDLYLGVFARDAIVRVEKIHQDSAGRSWYLVTFLYGDDFADGRMKWTATDTIWILADEATKTDQTDLTVTDYAYPLGTPIMRLMSRSTDMNGFSLKSISGSIGSFSVGDTAYGSSGRDRDYSQIATLEGHGKIYATPHYLEGYTVYCLEHTLPGPGENISGGGKQPTGPYTIVDWDGYMTTAGYSGAIYGEDTMHAIAWVLGHTYPFMVLDRSDSNNETWSRVAGQFAIREVIKQMEGAQYVRDYWDMDNFYAASNNAPGVYLEYARWLAKNAIAHARRTGEITVSNKSAGYANGSYYGTATYTTDADFMRISKNVGTLTGHTGGEDDLYYYLNSGDTVTVYSSSNSFAYGVESMMDDEAGFYVGVPSVEIQKVLIPIESVPYPTDEAFVDFAVTFGAAVITKTDAGTGAALPGATFEVINASGTVVTTAKTGADGTATFEDLQAGTYTIRETSAPMGYTLAVPNTQSLTVAAGQTAYATFANEKISGKIAIYKVDADSKVPLAGATFSVTDANGNTVATLVTDANGSAETGWLPYGTYDVTETAAPDHYINSGVSVTVSITEHGKTYTVEAENEPMTGGLIVRKKDAVTGTAIEGVQFNIYRDGELIATMTTDDNGVATCNGLDAGTYTVKEHALPTGYVGELAVLEGTVTSDVTTVLDATNMPSQSKIKIIKTDSVTGEPLPGAEFSIANAAGIVIGQLITGEDGTTTSDWLPYGVYTITETKAPDSYINRGFSTQIKAHENGKTYIVDVENEPTKGWIQLVKVDALDRTPIAGVVFDIYDGGELISSMTTNEDGVALSEPLHKGEYMVCEQENPTGYTDNLIVLDAVVKSDETTHLSCTNQPIQGRIQIMKCDQLTKEALAGAEFTVTRIAGLPSHNGSNDGEVVAVITTDANGMTITPLLTWGTYRIEETKVPEHYVDNSFSVEVTISEDQQIYTIDVENEPTKGWIRLTKTDRLNGNPIEGVQFDIYYNDQYGEGLAGTMVTDANGIAMSEPLRKGQYIVREHGETAGYVFEEIELAATVKSDEITDVAATNMPVLVQLTLYKRDLNEYDGDDPNTNPRNKAIPTMPNDYNIPDPATRGDGVLTGTVFQVSAGADILDRQGNVIYPEGTVIIESLTTAGDDASVTTEPLWPGLYAVQEITAPNGYQIDPNPFYVDSRGAAYQSTVPTVEYAGLSRNEVLYGAQAIVKVLGNNDNTTDPTRVEIPEAGAEFKVYLKSAGSYENARDFECDYLITDEHGYAMTKPLPYGVYVLEQTAGKDGYEIKGPIEFSIDGTESLVNPPPLTLSDKPILYRLKLIKTDADTGKVITLANTSFKIKDSQGKYITQTVYYPREMEIDTFTTDETGSVTLPEVVNWGHYFIEEIKAPEGYLIRTDELAVFIGNAGDQPGQTYEVEIEIPNEAVMGRIELIKTGLTMTGFMTTIEHGYEVTRPIYEDRYLTGATFEIRAAEDIIGGDGTLWYTKDTLVETITTSGTGSDLSKELPLGRYYLIETGAPVGYILEDVPYEADLTYLDGHTPVVTIQVRAGNKYLPASVALVKHKEVTEVVPTENGMVHQVITTAPGEGFTFGLYNAKDIHYANGTLMADTLMAVGVTDEQGLLHISFYYPHGEYYIKELAAPAGWKIHPDTFPVSILPDMVAEDAAVIQVVYPEVIYDELIYTPITLTKTDITGVETLPGALIEIRDSKGTLIYREFTDANGEIPDIPVVPGTYTFREVYAPEGYELNTAEMTFTVDELGNITGNTVIRDDYTRVTLVKQDMDSNPLAGVEFALLKDDEFLVAVAKSDAKGIVTFEKIPAGKYTICEVQPLPGYLLNDTVVHLTVDNTFVNPDEPLAVIENHPIEVILHKIDKDNKPLPGTIFGLFDSDGFLCMTALSDATGTVKFSYVSYGSYTIRELEAPDGYLRSQPVIPIEIDATYQNSAEPLATVVNQAARLQYKKVDTSGKLLPGVEFNLINADTGEIVEIVTSDDAGEFVFTRFTYGNWIVRETKTPEGYNIMPDIKLTVDESWVEPEPVTLVNIPNHYEFVKTDNKGNPMPGVRFTLEDGAGNILRDLVSGDDGVVHVTDLTPGVYIIREIETLEGYTLSEETIKVVIDEKYVVPDEMFRFVNYPNIQTGSGIAMTPLMWGGVTLVLCALLSFSAIVKLRKYHR